MMLISRVTTWADRVMVFSFCALIYFLPISIALVESFSGLVLLSYFVKRSLIFYSSLREFKKTEPMSFLKTGHLFLQSFKPVNSILNGPIGIFIFVGFLTIFISRYPVLSIKGFFFKLLEWAFLYFNFVECMTTPKRLKIFMSVFFGFRDTDYAERNGTKIFGNGFYPAEFADGGEDLFILSSPQQFGRISRRRCPDDFKFSPFLSIRHADNK